MRGFKNARAALKGSGCVCIRCRKHVEKEVQASRVFLRSMPSQRHSAKLAVMCTFSGQVLGPSHCGNGHRHSPGFEKRIVQDSLANKHICYSDDDDQENGGDASIERTSPKLA